MDSSLSESVQQSIRPGKCSDLYYPDPETAQKQCYRTSQNTRFIQGFQNLSGGSQTLTIPPNNGIQDIVVSMTVGTLPAGSSGYALPRGWGYAMISRISYRYGGSSQYFLSGQQVLQEALRKAPNGTSRDDLLALGGSALNNAQLLAGPASAYVWLPLPHCIPSADGKLPPIPSDLLTQQIQVSNLCRRSVRCTRRSVRRVRVLLRPCCRVSSRSSRFSLKIRVMLLPVVST